MEMDANCWRILFVASALQQVGILYTRVANAGFLTSLYVVFTPFLLWLGFRERPHWMDLLAVIAATVGAYFLSSAGKGFQFQNGDSLELIGAIFWGLHFVVLGKFASRFEPVSFACGAFLRDWPAQLPDGPGFRTPLAADTPSIDRRDPVPRQPFDRDRLHPAGLGTETHTATDAALILGLEAVFAAIAAWLALRQGLLPLQMLGCCIILAAVMFSQLKSLRPAKA